MHTNFIRWGVVLGCLVFILFAAAGYAPAFSPDPLQAAMKATGAQLEEYSINSWAKLPKESYSDEELAFLVEQIIKQLEMDEQGYEIVCQQRNKHRIVKAEIIKPDWHMTVMAQMVPCPEKLSGEEGYLVINLESLTGQYGPIIPLQEKIERIAKKNGDSPRISTCLIGWLDGKLMDGELKSIVESAFSAIDGVIIDQLEQDQYLSTTGFSSAIKEYLRLGGKKMNINIAVRYSRYDNRTYVIIGSPVIAREY